ncbi:hypothetical protein CEXT_591071 [Caerostris extrusa]|uniref:Uncharacterized protein n=1 Tax=Caerostris extrusa TaxID=172846 RepID=A0AAV4UU87_CAEEX|nr:hypothetical protein CEXT_591071 [Caerostris extrusa]
MNSTPITELPDPFVSFHSWGWWGQDRQERVENPYFASLFIQHGRAAINVLSPMAGLKGSSGQLVTGINYGIREKEGLAGQRDGRRADPARSLGRKDGYK